MEKAYLGLDKKDLDTLINAYAAKFYAALESSKVTVASNSELREIIKKLADFVRDYEDLLEREKKAEKTKKPKVEAITREVHGA